MILFKDEVGFSDFTLQSRYNDSKEYAKQAQENAAFNKDYQETWRAQSQAQGVNDMQDLQTHKKHSIEHGAFVNANTNPDDPVGDFLLHSPQMTSQLILHEEAKFNENMTEFWAYDDGKDNTTIGIGYNLDSPSNKKHYKKMEKERGYPPLKNVVDGMVPLNKTQAFELLAHSKKQTLKDVRAHFTNFDQLPQNQQMAFFDMAFNMGGPKMKKWKGLKQAAKDQFKVGVDPDEALTNIRREMIYGKDATTGKWKVNKWFKDVKLRAHDLIDQVAPYKVTENHEILPEGEQWMANHHIRRQAMAEGFIPEDPEGIAILPMYRSATAASLGEDQSVEAEPVQEGSADPFGGPDLESGEHRSRVDIEMDTAPNPLPQNVLDSFEVRNPLEETRQYTRND